MKTYPITIKSTNYTIKIDGPPGDFQFPTREERERWTSALRSGMYKQGINRLSPAVGCYCCLGVLQFIVSSLDPQIHEHHLLAHENWGANFMPPIDTEWKSGILPYGVKFLIPNNPLQSLPELNDSGMSFADIADIIDIVYNPDTY